MSKIFLSHSSKDNAKALAVAQWLEQSGWGDYFLDITPSRGLSPGERWQQALKTATDRCEAVLFLISPAWRDSNWCLAEFLLAKQLGKTIFGVLVESTALDSLPREMTAEWQLCDLVTGTERRTFHVHRDPIVPPTNISLAGAGLASLKLGLQKAGLDPSVFPWPPPNDPTRLPYRGLNALEVEDAAVFFGREAALIRGLDTLRRMDDRGERLFVILGASGAGKSSFLRAGLWPRLQRDDRHFLPVPVIRPERAAISGKSGLLASLESAFSAYKQPRTRAQLRTAIEQPHGILELVSDLQAFAKIALGPQADPPTVVFAIDQGEELFAKEGGEEAKRLLDLLGVLVAQSAGKGSNAVTSDRRIMVMVAIRSDSYERLQTSPSLAGARQTPFSLPPLAQAEYKMVIEGPAARATAAGRTLIVKPDLTEQLLKDAEGADALPLLAFVLERLLIEHGADGDLSLDEYKALDGLKGAIEAAITKAFDEPDRAPMIPADEATRIELLRRAFPSLVTVDEETEDKDTDQAKRLVATWSKLPPETHPLLERLVNARLLVQDQRVLRSGEEAIVVEVAHEALLRQWGVLTTWLKLEGANVKLASSVRRAATDWCKARGEQKADLHTWLVHRGDALLDAESLSRRGDYDSRLGPDARDYLNACRGRVELEQDERELHLMRIAKAQRRTKWLMWAIGLVLVVASGGILFQARSVAQRTALLLASEAETQSEKGYYERALRFAILAAQDSWLLPTAPKAQAVLVKEAVTFNPWKELGTGVEQAVFSLDGRKILEIAKNNRVLVWDSHTHELIKETQILNPGLGELYLSPKGDRVMTIMPDKADMSIKGNRELLFAKQKMAEVWDVSTGKLQMSLDGDGDRVQSGLYSPDGKTIVTLSSAGAAKVWNADTGSRIISLPDARAKNAIFSASGKHLLIFSDSRLSLRVWDIEQRKMLAELEAGKGIKVGAVSPDGRWVVAAPRSESNVAYVWDALTGKLVTSIDGHRMPISIITFSSDGEIVITGSGDGTVLGDRNNFEKKVDEMVRSEGGNHSCDQMSKELRKRRYRSAHAEEEDDTALGCQRDPPISPGPGEVFSLSHKGDLKSVEVSRDSRLLVTVSGEDSARLWDVRTGDFLAELQDDKEEREKGIRSATFSPGGEQIVTVSNGSRVRVWDIRGFRDPWVDQPPKIEVRRWEPSGDFFEPKLFGISKSGNIILWNVKTNEVSPTAVRGDSVRMRSVSWSQNKQTLLTRDLHGEVVVWDAIKGEEIMRLTGSFRDAALSSNGSWILTSQEAGPPQIWDVRTGNLLCTLSPSGEVTLSAQFSPDGKRVVTLSSDRSVRLWDSATGRLQTTLSHDGGTRNGLAWFSQDGMRVLSITELDERRSAVFSWDGRSGEQLPRASFPTTLGRNYDRITDTQVVSNSYDLVVNRMNSREQWTVWHIVTATPLAKLLAIRDDIVSAFVSSDGNQLAVTTTRGFTAVYDMHLVNLLRGDGLVDAVCREKLNGMSVLTADDVAQSPILSGRAGEDVCRQQSTLSRLIFLAAGR